MKQLIDREKVLSLVVAHAFCFITIVDSELSKPQPSVLTKRDNEKK